MKQPEIVRETGGDSFDDILKDQNADLDKLYDADFEDFRENVIEVLKTLSELIVYGISSKVEKKTFDELVEALSDNSKNIRTNLKQTEQNFNDIHQDMVDFKAVMLMEWILNTEHRENGGQLPLSLERKRGFAEVLDLDFDHIMSQWEKISKEKAPETKPASETSEA